MLSLTSLHANVHHLVKTVYDYLSFSTPVNPAADTTLNTTGLTFQNVSAAIYNATVEATVEQVIEQTKNVSQTLTQEAQKGMFTRLYDVGANIFNWGYSTVGYGGSFIQNLFHAGSESSKVVVRSSELGAHLLNSGKCLLEFADTIGIGLYHFYLQHGPQALSSVLQETEQRILQAQKEEEDKGMAHPQGWGLATLMFTIISAAVLMRCAQHLIHQLHKSKNQEQIEEITQMLTSVVKIHRQENNSVLGQIWGMTRFALLTTLGFSFAASIGIPFVACVPVGVVTPAVVAMGNWLWSKVTGKNKLEMQELETLSDCVQQMSEVMDKIAVNRSKDQLRTFLLTQVKQGDKSAVEPLMQLCSDSKAVSFMPKEAIAKAQAMEKRILEQKQPASDSSETKKNK